MTAKILTALCVLLPWFSASSAVGAAITGWDFESGTLQGWTNVSTSTTGPTSYIAADPGVPGTSWRPSGSFMASVTPFADRDVAQDRGLVLRSPTFSLVSGGQIAVNLMGGDGAGVNGGPNAIVPASDTHSSIAGASSTTGAGGTGFLGVALRRDSDGAYLLTRSRGDNGSNSGFLQVDFTEAALAPIIAANPGVLFTLDLIDTAHGPLGSVAMDTTTIPVSTNQSVVSGGGKWNVFERHSTGSVTGPITGGALLALPSGDPGIASETSGTADLIDFYYTDPAATAPAATGHFNNNLAFIDGGGNNFATRVTGFINVTQPGDITFGFSANDGARLSIDGVVVAEDSALGVASDTLGTIALASGVHSVEFTFFQAVGGAGAELYVATTPGTYTSLNSANFELLAAAVPEPSTFFLLGWTCIALLRRGRTNQ